MRRSARSADRSDGTGDLLTGDGREDDKPAAEAGAAVRVAARRPEWGLGLRAGSGAAAGSRRRGARGEAAREWNGELGMGARVTGGGSRGRVSNILPAPVPPPLASWAGPAGQPLELAGHYRAGLLTPCRAVPAHGRGCRPKHGHEKRAVPARARNGPGRVRAGPKKRASGRATGSRAAWPTITRFHPSSMGIKWPSSLIPASLRPKPGPTAHARRSLHKPSNKRKFLFEPGESRFSHRKVLKLFLS